MLKEYLYHKKNFYMEQREYLLKETKKFEMQLKENNKLIALMKEKNYSNYEEFSPRSVNVYQKNKIYELEEEKKVIFSKIEELNKKLASINEDLMEIMECITEYNHLVQNSSKN